MKNQKLILIWGSLLQLLPFFVLTAQEHKPSAYITFEQSFPQDYVLSIFQDSKGFMWFGTFEGLVRYDGYSYTTYDHDPNDPYSLSGNLVRAIHEDKDGILWIGTNKGLNHFNRKTEKFDHILHNPEDSCSISNNYIWSIYEDHLGNIWVGTSDGLNRFDQQNCQFQRFQHQPGNPFSLVNSRVITIYEDRQKVLWVGTIKGLSRFDRESGKFFNYNRELTPEIDSVFHLVQVIYEDHFGMLWVGLQDHGLSCLNDERTTFQHIPIQSTSTTSANDNKVFDVWEDQNGRLWVGTANGVKYFDRNTKQFHTLDPPVGQLSNARAAFITTIFEDISGSIWLGTYGGGVHRLHLRAPPFQHFDPIGLGSGGVRAILEDRSGKLWIGSDGLFYFDRNTGNFFPAFHNLPSAESLLKKEVTAICEDRFGDLWIGSWGSGILRWNADKTTFQHYLPGDSSGLNDYFINTIIEDHTGQLWFGTFRGGLNKFDRQSGQFFHYQSSGDSNGPSANYIRVVYEDAAGALWLGTEVGGLNRFDRQTGKFDHFKHDPAKPGSLSDPDVTTIYEDSEGTLWVGTFGGGLNRFHPETGNFSHYQVNQGLISNTVYGITQDNQGFLWIITKDGLSRLNPETNIFDNFDYRDGLQRWLSVPFQKSMLSGEIYLGGFGGLDLFHPDSIQINRYIPNIAISSLKRYNTRNKSDTAIEVKGISEKKEITLSHRDNILSFEFAALDFHQPDKNQYAYQLENFSNNWIQLGEKRDVIFTNLDAGAYTLRVKGSNNNGYWNEEGVALQIFITPPWWNTWQAWIVYILVSTAILYFLYSFQLHRKLMQQEAIRLRELDTAKTRLYANITHEFRTPLTVISGMASQIKQNPKRWLQKGLLAIQRNSNSLLDLVNQMLDLQKLESSSMPINNIQADLIYFLRYITESFHSFAENKNIKIHFLTELESLQMDYDPNKLQAILSNLLSNAIKYTPEKGEVHVIIERKEVSPAQLNLKIKDTGQGIPPDKLPHIFDRFYQVDDSETRVGEGTGIGLALTEELVKLLGGTIEVSSQLGKGSTFSVLLPISREAPIQEADGIAPIESQIPPGALPVFEQSITTQNNALPLLLIVEDNTDVVQYLIACLEPHYKMLVAQNGRLGLEKAIKTIPDIIISDVMMPEMNGYELCEKLKKDNRTSHIPIILLTAKADIDSKIEGLKTGADAYLAKPFHKEELYIRLKKLIEQRQQLQLKYSRLDYPKQKTGHTEDQEHKFLIKIKAIVDRNLTDPSFGQEQLCRKMGVSRTQMHRKLSALTNRSTSIYIRSIRLKKAKELLKDPQLTISEVAYDTGFSTPQYFTRCFVAEFKITPTQFRKELQIN